MTEGLFAKFNDFLKEHEWILITELSLIVVTIIGLNVASFIHAYYGNKHPFPMAISAAVIFNIILFIPYIIVFFKKGSRFELALFFYLNYTIINVIHWVVAHRYFQSTVYLPYIIRAEQVPQRDIVFNKVLFWVVTVLIFASGIYIFLDDNDNWQNTLFYVAAVLVTVPTSVMWLALYRIKKTISTMSKLKSSINVGRMCNHSLSYTIFTLNWIFFELFQVCFPDSEIAKDVYASWMLTSLLGFVSFIYFFLIVWHLGTQEQPRALVIETEVEGSFAGEFRVVHLLGSTEGHEPKINGRRPSVDVQTNRLDGMIWSMYLKPEETLSARKGSNYSS